VQPRFVADAKNELGNKIRRSSRRLAERHAQSQKISGVHFVRSKLTCELAGERVSPPAIQAVLLLIPARTGRVKFVAGDFITDPLPPGADLAWVSAIVHQNSRKQNRQLFAKAFHALMPAGRIVIRDILMHPTHTHPVAGALFAVNMLVVAENEAVARRAETRLGPAPGATPPAAAPPTPAAPFSPVVRGRVLEEKPRAQTASRAHGGSLSVISLPAGIAGSR